MKHGIVISVAALLLVGGNCSAQLRPNQGSAMTRPAEASWGEMQASLKASKGPGPSIPMELGSGGTAKFYPNSSALLPQSREQLARELNKPSVYRYPANQYICNSEVWVVAHLPKRAPEELEQKADKRLVRQRIQAVFTWLMDHGYDRELLVGELRPSPTGEADDSVEYDVRLGLIPGAECEMERQKLRTAIRGMRGHPANKLTMEFPR